MNAYVRTEMGNLNLESEIVVNETKRNILLESMDSSRFTSQVFKYITSGIRDIG